jgi:hypothetical protein
MLGIPTVLVFISWIAQKFIPDTWVIWYYQHDKYVDIVVTLFLIFLTHIFFQMILQSHIVNGPVYVTAVEFGESGFEIIMLIIVLILLMIHMTMQMAFYNRRVRS